MLAPKNRVISGIILFVCLTCNYPDKQSGKDGHVLVDWGTGKSPQTPVPEEKAATKRKIRGRQKDFLDSVLVKMDLSFDQIKEHSNIDTIYDKDDAEFSGDTVWFRNGKRPLAVIRYDDRGRSKRFLLVFNRKGKCTASLMVEMDGDVDGGFDSVSLSYRIFDNNNFSTTETWKHKEG